MGLDKRKINSKGWLYLALLDLLKTKKIEDITVSELASHASIGRATFYRLYNSIDDLLMDELKLEVDSFLEYMQNIDIYDIKNYLNYLFMYWNENIEIIEVLLIADKISLFYQVLNEKFQGPYDVSFIFGGSIQTLIQWVKNGRKLSISEVVDQVSTKLHI